VYRPRLHLSFPLFLFLLPISISLILHPEPVSRSSSSGWSAFRPHERLPLSFTRPYNPQPPTFPNSLSCVFPPLICMATAINFHPMASNLPLDFMPIHHNHSRSNSVSSSPNSRPQSSQGGVLRTVGPLSAEDLFRASYHPRPNLDPHARNTSHTSSSYSIHSTDLISPADSPPNHNLTNPALKNHIRASHIRARAAASPYPRDADSVHSSSSETEDPSMFLAGSPADYPSMFAGGPIVSSQDTVHATGAFGRMTLSPDHTLEKLAANVRAATTTSASDRAKQIFVQAW